MTMLCGRNAETQTVSCRRICKNFSAQALGWVNQQDDLCCDFTGCSCVPIYRSSLFADVPFTHNVDSGNEQIYMGGTLLSFPSFSDGYIDVITGCPPVCLLFRCIAASRNIPRGFFAREAMPRRWPQSRMVGIKFCLSREVRRRVPRAGTIPACTVVVAHILALPRPQLDGDHGSESAQVTRLCLFRVHCRIDKAC
jgi:hypothetical protein